MDNVTIIIIKDFKLVDYNVSPRKTIKRKRTISHTNDIKLISKRYKFDNKIILLTDIKNIVDY